MPSARCAVAATAAGCCRKWEIIEGRARLSTRFACPLRQVKTPGGELVLHYMGKKGKGPICGDCKGKLSGVRCHPLLRLRAPMRFVLPLPRRLLAVSCR